MKTSSQLFLLMTALAICGNAKSAPLVSSTTAPVAASAGAALDCFDPDLSADGRFVVFVSAADNLVTHDHNGSLDVFVRDRQLGQTLLVSVNASGASSGNGPSLSPAISADGRYVVFESAANDLVPSDTNRASDVFLRDLVTGTTTLISVSTNGVNPGNRDSGAPSITPDGRFVLFASRAGDLANGDANNAVDLFVRDVVAGTTTLVTANSSNTGSFAGKSVLWSGNRQISSDGRWVSFDSSVANLVAGDTNAKIDVFLRDVLSAKTLIVSSNSASTGLGNGDSQSVSMDASGRYVAFHSAASNLTTNDANTALDVFVRDRELGTTRLVSVNTGGGSSGASSTTPVLSKDGNVVVFISTANDLVAGDSNTSGADLFRRDLAAETTTLVSSGVSPLTTTSAIRMIPRLSGDGRYVLYLAANASLALYDAASGVTTAVAPYLPTLDAVISDDGNFVVYAGAPESTGARNIYLYDNSAGVTELISACDPGRTNLTAAGSSRLYPGSVSADGQLAVFESAAADLGDNDTNGLGDVWLYDLAAPSRVRLATLLDGISRGPLRRPIISSDGRWVVYEAIPDSTALSGLSTRFNLYAYDRFSQNNILVAGVGKVSSPSFPALSQTSGCLSFQSSQTGVAGYASTISQVYYRDLSQDSNRLVSLNRFGTAPGAGVSSNSVISPNGRYVAYLSASTDLVTNTVSGVGAFLWDSATGSNSLVSGPGSAAAPVTRVAFVNDEWLAFQRLTNTYLFGLASGAVSLTLTDAVNVSFSADAKYAACERQRSYSPLDTNGTTDVYRLDLSNGQTSLISVSREGGQGGNARSGSPVITSDGRYVFFRSRASNLVPNDTNGLSDLFLRDTLLGRTILVSINAGAVGSGDLLSSAPVVSADGATALFESYASDLVAGDFNASRDLFVLHITHNDTDSDGLADDWELAYFNGLQRDGMGDLDGDGQSDKAEFLAGTDPANPGSRFRALTVAPLSQGPLQVLWAAVPGKNYRVEYKDSLSTTNWTVIPGDVTATDTTASKPDANYQGIRQRYYRVRLLE